MRRIFFRYDPLVTISLLAVIFIVSQVIASVLVSLYPALKSWTEAQSLAWLKESTGAQFMYILLAEVIMVFFILRILRWIKVKPQQIGLVKPAIRDLGYALIAYGLYFIVSLLVRLIAAPLLTGINFEQEQQIGFESAYSYGELAMVFLSLAVIVPIAEEVMFRGFLFSSLRAKYKFHLTAVITSLLFGIAHLQFGSDAPLLWVAAIDTFILSYFLCHLREQTNSLWSPILLHFIKNSVAFLILFGPRFL